MTDHSESADSDILTTIGSIVDVQRAIEASLGENLPHYGEASTHQIYNGQPHSSINDTVNRRYTLHIRIVTPLRTKTTAPSAQNEQKGSRLCYQAPRRPLYCQHPLAEALRRKYLMTQLRISATAKPSSSASDDHCESCHELLLIIFRWEKQIRVDRLVCGSSVVEHSLDKWNISSSNTSVESGETVQA
uniref:NTP_transf_2 domain-containing protein n=1 Tax=Ascaris lumbricoides TaxID=6252 RepID=A0A0M3I0Y1_ASCLU